MSVVQLLQWTMATLLPLGVVTISISLWTESFLSVTTMAKSLVPALTFPVSTLMEFVATMPVPASPSGGAIGIPASRSPSLSRILAPVVVRNPAFFPATSTLGKRENMSKPVSWKKSSAMAASKSFVCMSIGNMPEASSIPMTFSPVRSRWTKEDRVST